MCMGSAPKAPAPAPSLPEAPVLPNTDSSLSGTAESRRRTQANSTVLTSARGLGTTSSGASKTLLGS